MSDLYCRLDGNLIGDPAPLPFEARTPTGDLRTDLAGQLAEGWINRGDLRELGLLPARRVEPPFDPAMPVLVEVSRSIEDDEVVFVFEARPAPEPPTISLDGLRAERRAVVMAARERRMRAGFTFAGAAFDYDEGSQRRITGAAALAGFAMSIGGKAPGDLRWHGGDEDFQWIARDNARLPMDAPTCFAFGQAAAAWETTHVFVASDLKAAIDAAPDAAAVMAIDVEAGWPAPA